MSKKPGEILVDDWTYSIVAGARHLRETNAPLGEIVVVRERGGSRARRVWMEVAGEREDVCYADDVSMSAHGKMSVQGRARVRILNPRQEFQGAMTKDLKKEPDPSQLTREEVDSKLATFEDEVARARLNIDEWTRHRTFCEEYCEELKKERERLAATDD